MKPSRSTERETQMEIEQLRYFLEVCRTGSFSAAADNLYISQPTISKKIMALENELNVVLLNRQKQSVTPTTAGRYLMERAARIIAKVDEAEARTKAIGAGRVGFLRIGISDQLDINGILPGFLKEFISSVPTVDVSLSVYNASALYSAVSSGEIDGAFIPNAGDPNPSCGLSCIQVNRASPRLYYSTLHPKARRPKLSPADFVKDTLYTLGGAKTETQKRLKSAGLEFPNIVVVESMQILKMCVEANLGVTVLGVSQNLDSYDRILSIPLPLKDFKVGTDFIYDEQSDNTCVPILCKALKDYLKI